MQRKNNFGLKRLATALMIGIFLFGVVPLGVLPVPALANNPANVVLEIDKAAPADYPRGAAVTFTIINNDNIDWYIDCDGIKIFDWQALNNGQGVDSIVAHEELVRPCTDNENQYKVGPGQTHTWAWFQKYSVPANNPNVRFNGQQVPDGEYIGYLPYTDGTVNNGVRLYNQAWTHIFNIERDFDKDGVPDAPDPDQDNDGVCDPGESNSPNASCRYEDKCLDTPPAIAVDETGCILTLGSGGGITPPVGAQCDTREPQCALDVRKAEARLHKINVVQEAIMSSVIGTGVSCFFPPVIGCFIGGAVSAGLEVWQVRSAHKTDDRIIRDPPDPNYKMPVALKRTQVKLLEWEDEESKLINDLILAGIDYEDAVNAFVSANEKFMGADQAQDPYWRYVHAVAARNFATLAAQKLGRLNEVLNTVGDYIVRHLGINGNVIVIKEQLIEFQNKVRAEGAAALPQIEIDLIKNYLGGTDEDVQKLVDAVLSVDPEMWQQSFVGQRAWVTNADNRLIDGFRELASELGWNVAIGNRLEVPVLLSTLPEETHSFSINIKYDTSRYTFDKSSELMIPGIKATYKITETKFGELTLDVTSSEGIPAGTTGALLYLRFIPRDVGINIAIKSLAGDASKWLAKDIMPIVPPAPPVSIFKNGAWVFVRQPTSPPPQFDPTKEMPWWDGVQWLLASPPQYGLVWTGTGWSGTGPGTIPPKGVMYADETTPVGKYNVWDGYQYILADKVVVDTSQPPATMQVFDVGTKMWTFTNPPPRNLPV